MPKKIAPKLIQTDQVIYAVLSEGNGFLKELYGDVHFYDNLPRASGCFVTKAEAVDAKFRAIEKSRFKVKEATITDRLPPYSDYFEKRAKETFKQAQEAIVVEISIRNVV